MKYSYIVLATSLLLASCSIGVDLEPENAENAVKAQNVSAPEPQTAEASAVAQ